MASDNGQVVPEGTGQDFSFRPSDNGIYTVAFTVTDDDGGTGADSLVVTVTDLAPTIELGGPSEVAEGSPYELILGPVTDPGSDTVSRYTVNWGDGTSSLYPAGGVVTHTYAEGDQALSISVDLEDEDGLHQAAGSLALQVKNVAPELSGLSVSPAYENEQVTLTGQILDPGVLDSFVLTMDWGDGSPLQSFEYGPGTTAFAATHLYLDDRPGGGSDAYVISLTVSDDDGGSGTAEAIPTLSNVAPVITVLAVNPETVDENGWVTLTGSFSDAGPLDTHSVLVDWGDGCSSAAEVQQESRTFSAVHQYLDDAPSGTVADSYAIGVTATDDDGGSGSGGTTVTVANLAPAITLLTIDPPLAAPMMPVTLSCAFTDPGTLDSWTAAIDWGDGIAETVSVYAGQLNKISHAYGEGGLHMVTVTVTDDDGGSAGGSTSVLITGVTVKDGVLYIAGSEEDDLVAIFGRGFGARKHRQPGCRDPFIIVYASFLADPKHVLRFAADSIESIRIYMGGGDDRVTIARYIVLPARIEGGEGNDFLRAGGGPCEIYGENGNDRLFGGPADDLLDGGEDDDWLLGGPGDDILFGGPGDDFLCGGPGTDVLDGGPGRDILRDAQCRRSPRFTCR